MPCSTPDGNLDTPNYRVQPRQYKPFSLPAPPPNSLPPPENAHSGTARKLRECHSPPPLLQVPRWHHPSAPTRQSPAAPHSAPPTGCESPTARKSPETTAAPAPRSAVRN